MGEVPVQLIVGVFDEEETAAAVLNELLMACSEKLIGIQSAAVLSCNEKNKLKVHVIEEPLPRKTIGAALLSELNARFNSLLGKKPMPCPKNERLQRLGSSLSPGSSAIIAVIEHKWVSQLALAQRALTCLAGDCGGAENATLTTTAVATVAER